MITEWKDDIQSFKSAILTERQLNLHVINKRELGGLLSMVDQGHSQTSEQDEASLSCWRRKPLGGSGGMLRRPPENIEI